jgi:hypothetical protein
MWFRINDITFCFALKATKLLKIHEMYDTKAIPRLNAIES